MNFRIRAREFQACVDAGRKSDALAICEEMIRDFPQLSFYHFWRKRLMTEVKVDSVELDVLGQEILTAFSSLPYDLEVEDFCGDDYQGEKDRIVSKLPYKGEIYLPTKKITLRDQIVGLRNVEKLVMKENKEVSKSRFNELRRIIRSTGKKRIFVVGNGPSLKKTDLSLLKDEITIGFNGVFLHQSFTPSIHIVEDHLVAEDRVDEIINFDCPVKIFPSYLNYILPAQQNTIFLNHIPRRSFPVDTDFSDRAEEITFTGGTVTFTGLQVAASLGFEEIILVGVDASYKVENVKRSTDYGVGVLESKSDDTNHFDPTYFGKGFRWHDPNVHTMLQAYRKVRSYAERTGKRVVNATIGGELEVFPRVPYWDLFDLEVTFPKCAVLDFTHVDWMCATGIVKNNMFSGWEKHSLLHLHGQNPATISAFQKVSNDCYAPGADQTGAWAALRSLIEYDPKVLYSRPTHDRPAMSLLQLVAPVLLGKPFVIHYMDDWLAKLEIQKGFETAKLYRRMMGFLFEKANRVLTISAKMADYLHRDFNVPEQKLQVVHNYIQPLNVMPLARVEGKVVRYFGGMEPDMSLATIHHVANAIASINESGPTPVKFEIFTGANYIERFGGEFSTYKHTSLVPQNPSYLSYLSLLAHSDLNVLCYNFDEESETYLKYSMANKLPEIVGSQVPFLAIGSEEIGTISYLKAIRFPFLVLEDKLENVRDMIYRALFNNSAQLEDYSEALACLHDEFSEERNRWGFHKTMREVAGEPSPQVDENDFLEIKAIFDSLLDQMSDDSPLKGSVGFLMSILYLSDEDRRQLLTLVKSHGLVWGLNDNRADIMAKSAPEKLAYLISSLDNARFEQLLTPIKQSMSNLKG